MLQKIRTLSFTSNKRPRLPHYPVVTSLTRCFAVSPRRSKGAAPKGVTFQFKDYRAKGRCRYKPMTLPVAEFMRRFLLHVLPPGFHRIRHYGLLANATRVENLARARELLAAPLSPLIAVPGLASEDVAQETPTENARPCPCCGAPMVIIETFAKGHAPRAPPSAIGEAA